jgi:hypothetical protein
LELPALELTKHFSEKGHQGGETRPRWVLGVWYCSKNFVALLVPLTTCVQHRFQERFFLLFRNDLDA